MMNVDTVATGKTPPVRILEEADLDAVGGGYQQVWLGVLRAVLQFDRGTALRNQACHPSAFE